MRALERRLRARATQRVAPRAQSLAAGARVRRICVLVEADMARLGALILAGLVLCGCTTAPALPLRRQALSGQIAADAAAFNEAYAQAVSAQILLNILRARDRMPRFYLAMTGISDAPSLRFQENAGAGSIPLGEGASPWGFGSLGITRETISRPSYAVQPFNADTLTRTAFEPIAPYVFAHYWKSGWPRDLLLLLMVERIDKTDGAGPGSHFINEANVIFSDCGASVDTSGCAFVREVRDFLIGVENGEPERVDDPNGQPICGLLEAYGATPPVREAAPAHDQQCDPVFVMGATRLTLHLRSLDDIIYYVGELMRAGSMDEHAGIIEAQVNVAAAGLRGGGRGVPLFRIVRASAARRGAYAASVAYAGAHYVAGPAIGRSCGEATLDGPCRDDAENGDRSSSVLSLLAELMALNQSPDAIRAPNRLIAE
jgi:hypothetical protein